MIKYKNEMIKRNIITELERWKNTVNRKPLLLRGARQVGKTTVVNQFSVQFKQYIYLNLERKEDASIFQNYINFRALIEGIFFLKDKNIQEENTLIFIDEIQEIPTVINLLRYFYEDYPNLYVIAAGSLLETILNEYVTVPVGRIEYKVMRPLAFNEFLDALGEYSALQQYENTPINDFAHDKLLQLFNTYTRIGGMPEIVNNYAKNRNLTILQPIYDSLFASYMNDVEKYARNSTMTQVIRHIVKSMSVEAGNRIKFQHFGQSNYGSREVGEAFRVLEKALLLYLVYPTLSPNLPVFADKKKSPRLQILDTGLLNYSAGIQKELVNTPDLEKAFKGKIIEHIVGQELLTTQFSMLNELNFWTREKKDSEAEIDFIRVFEGILFPIEVKSGATGSLRSLQAFMNVCSHPWAVRMYSGRLSVDTLKTQNQTPFFLLNLPYYLSGKIDFYLKWFMEKY